MKKQSIVLLLLVLLLVLPITVQAASGDSQAQLSYVTDTYGLLSTQQAQELEALAAKYSAEHACSFYILVVHNYRDYASTPFQFTKDTYFQYHLGWGNEQLGSVLMLSMADRDYELMFNGDETDAVFTEYGRDLMIDRFLDYFRNDDFYGGFREYLRCCDEYYDAYESGSPIDRQKEFSILFFLPGIIAAVAVGLVLYAPMNSTGLKRSANAYITPGSLHLTQHYDLFINRTVHRVRRETENHSSGSSHRSGSSSGRSGKF